MNKQKLNVKASQSEEAITETLQSEEAVSAYSITKEVEGIMGLPGREYVKARRVFLQDIKANKPELLKTALALLVK